jgi:hypothetical protein
VAAGGRTTAILTTPRGRLAGPDYVVEVRAPGSGRRHGAASVEQAALARREGSA